MTNQTFDFEAITDEVLSAANGGAGSNGRFELLEQFHGRQPVTVQSVHGPDGSTKLQNLTVNFG